MKRIAWIVTVCFSILCRVVLAHAQALLYPGEIAVPACRVPAWQGRLLDNCENPSLWEIELGPGSTGSITSQPKGVAGSAIQMNWNLGTSLNGYCQVRLDLSPAVDISPQDLLGISLQGAGGTANRVSVMFADTSGTFFGLDLDGITTTNRWMINLPLPFRQFRKFWGPGERLDWRHIDRMFIVVKRPGGGGTGTFGIDQIQVTKASGWPRQTKFLSVKGNLERTGRAVEYLVSQQQSTGLFTSWREEPPPLKAHLYDQALVLLVLTREGRTTEAARLVQFLRANQKKDGHWARTWNSVSGVQLIDDRWVGDQAWCIFALKRYADRFQDASASDSAGRGAVWLAKRVPPSGRVVASTEGNVDCWWALTITAHSAEAARIANHLLNDVWDPDLGYWWRGHLDPVVALDAQTWLSAFSRASEINHPELGRSALSFARRTLVTRSAEHCGFDGMGPVGVWCEGTAQYVAAGGTDAQPFLQQLMNLQRPDGSMPGSTDDWSSTAFGWLSTWSGISSTSWFYFANTGSPWAELID